MATESSKKEVPEDPESPTSPMTSQDQPQPPPSPLEPKRVKKCPCPCCELRRGVLCIAICGIVFNTFWIITAGLIYGLIDMNDYWSGFTIYYMIIGFMGLITSIILAIGSAKKMGNMVRCAFSGFILCFISHLIGGVLNIGYIAKMETDKTARTWEIVGIATWMITFLTVHVYMTYAIYVYAKKFGPICRGCQAIPRREMVIGQRTREWSMANTGYGRYHPPRPTPQESPESSNVDDSQSPMGQGQDSPKVPEGTGQKG